MRGQAEKKVLTKDLLCPMTGEGSGIISSEPKVIAMGFAPLLYVVSCIAVASAEI